jgi:hypothetical protein
VTNWLHASIYKYRISGAPCKVAMPHGAVILSVQMQGADLCVWALVEPGREPEARIFEVYGTGAVFDSLGLEHAATVQDGAIVLHVFERHGWRIQK